MLDTLRAHDSGLIELTSERGSVLIPPRLNGRIFSQLDGELIHRLDTTALLNPSGVEYNNLGGNSLWPAPEGGAFAFNYQPNSSAWYVQKGIAEAIPSVRPTSNGGAVVEKSITLTNRKGAEIDLVYRREVSLLPQDPAWEKYSLAGLAYATIDIWEPAGEYSPDAVLIAPWSLEQFPGAEGVIAFGRYAIGANAINRKFYGDPDDRIEQRGEQFTFRLGGVERHQIGVRVESRPQFIGAFDPSREILLIRKTELQDALYFDIADNEQIDGPFSTADSYSIFNGGELGFFELETIGGMRVENGRITTSALPSQTFIFRGKETALRQLLAMEFGVRI
ncbi:MAG: hypothetical protein IT366_09185 [Candidatus Hydrogenedentes bacterium]|nr:hypothetical protein [Candidatus Hydrogenedentota bacterium]